MSKSQKPIDWTDARTTGPLRGAWKYASEAERIAGNRERHRNRSMRYRVNLKARGLRLVNGRIQRFKTCTCDCECSNPVNNDGWCGMCIEGLCE